MEGFDDIIPTSDKCYYISSYDDYQTWDDALSICNEMIDWSYDIDYNSQNTQLVSINSNSENNQIYDQLAALQIASVWIGLSWNGKILNNLRMAYILFDLIMLRVYYTSTYRAMTSCI